MYTQENNYIFTHTQLHTQLNLHPPSTFHQLIHIQSHIFIFFHSSLVSNIWLNLYFGRGRLSVLPFISAHHNKLKEQTLEEIIMFLERDPLPRKNVSEWFYRITGSFLLCIFSVKIAALGSLKWVTTGRIFKISK